MEGRSWKNEEHFPFELTSLSLSYLKFILLFICLVLDSHFYFHTFTQKCKDTISYMICLLLSRTIVLLSTITNNGPGKSSKLAATFMEPEIIPKFVKMSSASGR